MPSVTNNASVSMNNQSYCGLTLYTLIISANSAGNTLAWSFDNVTLVLAITPSIIGTYQVVYTAQLDSYPSVSTSTTFNYVVNPSCS